MPTQAMPAPKDPASVTALMPQPRSVQYGDGWLPVRGGFQVTWVTYRNPVLDRAVSRFQKDVARRTGLDVGRTGPAQLQVNCRGKDRGYLTINTNEQYSLTYAGNRQRMAARLAPGESEQVELPPDLVAPARNQAHNQVGGKANAAGSAASSCGFDFR